MDPDQKDSPEASRSVSTVFSKKNKSRFSKTRVYFFACYFPYIVFIFFQMFGGSIMSTGSERHAKIVDKVNNFEVRVHVS